MVIKFILNYPAIFLADKKILVISDLHIGLEHELFRSGIIISPQAEKFKKIIDRLIELTKAKILIILGDIKHKVPGISYREEKEIPRLFNHLIEKVKVIVAKGNHDDNISTLLPKKVKIYSSRGFKVGRYSFFHGHAWPSEELMKCDHLLMAHVHPSIEFRDKLGYRSIEQVWVRGKLNEELVKRKYKIKNVGKLKAVIVPTFNKLLGGVALNRILDEDLIGPILANKFIDVNKAKAYLLDGTFLGNIENFKI